MFQLVYAKSFRLVQGATFSPTVSAAMVFLSIFLNPFFNKYTYVLVLIPCS